VFRKTRSYSFFRKAAWKGSKNQVTKGKTGIKTCQYQTW